MFITFRLSITYSTRKKLDLVMQKQTSKNLKNLILSKNFTSITDDKFASSLSRHSRVRIRRHQVRANFTSDWSASARSDARACGLGCEWRPRGMCE